jgi:hypothetical protein
MLSIPISLVAGFVLLIAWYVFSLVFLGYGDSAPSWVNNVNDIAFFGGTILSLIVCQLALPALLDKVKKHK